MHRCLRIPEVVREICGVLQRSGALSMALTCRQFLEPGLDKVWADVTAFNALIACMPEDLWRVEERVGEGWANFGQPTTVYSLSRALRSSDIDRYLKFYAHRIRVFRILGCSGFKWIDLDALQALQVTTNWELGALSPLLEEMVWEGPDTMASLLGEEWASHFSPSMSLLWGPKLQSLCLTLEEGQPLHATSINGATTLITKLKRLDIMMQGGDQHLIDEYLSSYPWPGLQYLRASTIAPSTIHHLGSLPCLATLELLSLKGNPLPLLYSATTHSTLISEARFSNLKTLELESAELAQITAFIQQMPATSPVEVLVCISSEYAPPLEAQNAVESIRLHANPNTLRSLLLRDESDEYGDMIDESIEEPLELDPDASIDIASLLAFKHLTFVQVLFKETILVTPDLIARIPEAWPGLTVLDLCSQIPSTRMPLIDHTHLLYLLRRCKSLLYLGLRFDATKIRGSELDLGAPFALRGLRVGDSPILSPSRVLGFLERNMPDLARPERYIGGVTGVESLYMRRWKKVEKSRAWPKDSGAPWH